MSEDSIAFILLTQYKILYIQEFIYMKVKRLQNERLRRAKFVLYTVFGHHILKQFEGCFGVSC